MATILFAILYIIMMPRPDMVLLCPNVCHSEHNYIVTCVLGCALFVIMYTHYVIVIFYIYT